MPRDIKAFLKDDLGFTDDELAAVLPRFEAKRDVFDRAFQTQEELTAKQAELDAANQRLTSEMAEWATIRNTDSNEAKKLRERIEKSEQRVALLSTRLTSFAEEHGVDPKDVLPEGGDVLPAPRPESTEPDPRYLRTDQMGPMFNLLVTIPAELQAIAQEHFDLTGQRLDPRELVSEFKAGLAKNQNVDIRQIWEAKHGIPAIRTQKQTERHNTELEAAREEGRQQARTEQVLPGQSSVGRNAIVFRTSEHGTSGSKLQRPQPGNTVSRAAAALATHKYRKDETTTH